MKRFIAALAVLGMFNASAFADTTVTSSSRGVAVKVCTYDAHAVCSLKWNGVEFIDDYDHGRQLQSAVSFDGKGEAYNPTEAGAAYPYNGLNPSATSSVAGSVVTGGTEPKQLSTTSIMAYWNPVAGVAKSNWSFDKTILLTEGTYATYLKYTVSYWAYAGSAEPNHSTGTFESLTGYMPADKFNVFYTLDVKGTKALASIGYCTPPFTNCSPEQPLPLIFTNSTGTHAMGIYNRALPQSAYPGAGFGRWDFYRQNGTLTPTDKVTKWNSVFRLTNIQKGVKYDFTNYVIVGTLANVKLQMQWLYDNGY